MKVMKIEGSVQEVTDFLAKNEKDAECTQTTRSIEDRLKAAEKDFKKEKPDKVNEFVEQILKECSARDFTFGETVSLIASLKMNLLLNLIIAGRKFESK